MVTQPYADEPLSPDWAPDDDEAGLLAAARAGDPDAYGVLYTRHLAAAKRCARLVGTTSDVDDLVSEAFAKVYAMLRRGGGPEETFLGYVLTTVRHLAVDRYRAEHRLRTVGDLAPYDSGVVFEDPIVAGFEASTAAEAFASLRPRWQQVLQLIEVEGLSPRQVAGLLGITPNNVHQLTFRARRRLRMAYAALEDPNAPQPPGPVHCDDATRGTPTGLNRHKRRGEQPCPACREVQRAYERSRYHRDRGHAGRTHRLAQGRARARLARAHPAEYAAARARHTAAGAAYHIAYYRATRDVVKAHPEEYAATLAAELARDETASQEAS